MALYPPPTDNSDYIGWDNYFKNIDTYENLVKAIDKYIEKEDKIWSYASDIGKGFHFTENHGNGNSYHHRRVWPDKPESAYTRTLGSFPIVLSFYNHYYEKYIKYRWETYKDLYDKCNGSLDGISLYSKPKYFHNYPDGTGNYPLSKEEYINRIITIWRDTHNEQIPPPHE